MREPRELFFSVAIVLERGRGSTFCSTILIRCHGGYQTRRSEDPFDRIDSLQKCLWNIAQQLHDTVIFHVHRFGYWWLYVQ
jgi:hypothetical protein